MSNSRKKQKTGSEAMPKSEDELKRRMSNFVLSIGADVKLKPQGVLKCLNDSKMDWFKVGRFLERVRKWIISFDENRIMSDKEEENILSEQELIDYFDSNCGSKSFKNWLPRINAFVDTATYNRSENEFYEDGEIVRKRKISKKKKKNKKRKRSKKNNNNNTNNDNDNQSVNRFNMDDLDNMEMGSNSNESGSDSSSESGSESSSSDEEDDDIHQLRKRQQRKIKRKRSNNTQDDMVTIINGSQYNKCGLKSERNLQWLRSFTRDKELNITDLRSVDQFDENNLYLLIYALRDYFEYYRNKEKDEDSQKAIDLIEKDVYFMICKEFMLEILPKGLNNQIFALINSFAKPAELYNKLHAYLNDAANNDNFKMKWNVISEPLMCKAKALTGVCLNFKTCKFIHGMCSACKGMHRSGDCRQLPYKVKKMINMNHSFNWKNHKKFNSNNNNNTFDNNWNKQTRRNWNNRQDNNNNSRVRFSNDNNNQQPSQPPSNAFNPNNGSWQWTPNDTNNNSQNNGNH